MGQDAALQIVVKFAFHISRQACGIRISIARGEKGLEMVRNDFIEHRAARIAWFVGAIAGAMRAPDVQYRGYGYARKYHRLYCTYVQYSRKYFSVERERTARRDAGRRGRLHA
jgi:hypothetical protein